jgi:hypothetical protein
MGERNRLLNGFKSQAGAGDGARKLARAVVDGPNAELDPKSFRVLTNSSVSTTASAAQAAVIAAA